MLEGGRMNTEMLYIAVILLTSIFVAAVSVWLWSDALDLSARLFVVTLLAHPVIGLFVVAELLAPTRSLAVLSFTAHTALSLLVPIGYFLFAFTFASNRRRLPRRLAAVIGLYAAVVVGLEASNPLHYLARDGYEVVGATVPHLTATPTTAFGLLTLPPFVAYYAAIGILGYRFLPRREGRWMQTLVLFVGFAPPFVVSGLWFGGLLVGPLDGGFVVGSAWTAAFAGWAVYRYQLFDVVPLAREAVFEALDERVIVVDDQRRLLDYNDDAAETFPELVGNRGQRIDDLLTLSREGRTIDDRQRVSLIDVAESAWRTTDTGDATLVLDVDERTTVYADRTRLLNVFENLFRNALEHGDPPVTITLGRHDDGFYVEDDGPGIPLDHRESVFEYEFTTTDGTGLGLAIVDAIAQAHGWQTAATAGNDGGARIVFSGVSLTDAETRTGDAGAVEVQS